jgi:hypothetical protein
VTDLPKTATGKIQKYVLRGGAANLSRQLSPGGRPPVPPDVRATGPDRKNRDRIRPAARTRAPW